MHLLHDGDSSVWHATAAAVEPNAWQKVGGGRRSTSGHSSSVQRQGRRGEGEKMRKAVRIMGDVFAADFAFLSRETE